MVNAGICNLGEARLKLLQYQASLLDDNARAGENLSHGFCEKESSQEVCRLESELYNLDQVDKLNKKEFKMYTQLEEKIDNMTFMQEKGCGIQIPFLEFEDEESNNELLGWFFHHVPGVNPKNLQKLNMTAGFPLLTTYAAIPKDKWGLYNEEIPAQVRE